MKNDRLILNYQTISPELDFKIGWVHYYNTMKPMELHSHGNAFELVYFISGSQTFVINEKEETIRGGDWLFFLSPMKVTAVAVII